MGYLVWVVEVKTLKPTRLVDSLPDAEEALSFAGGIVRGFGSALLSARNVEWMGGSLLVYDPSGLVTLGVLVEGLSVVEEDRSPVSSPLSPISTQPEISE
jgi:hypothetical protein